MTGNLQKAPRNLGGIDRDKLDGIVVPIARANGAEIQDIEFKIERGQWILRIFVEKLGAEAGNMSTQQAAVDLELCSNVARDLGTALDVADLVPHAYHLEVSSPGIERPLRGERDYVRFAGKKAKVRLTNTLRGQKVLVGILGTPRDGTLSIKDGPQTYEVPFADVESGRLVFEFGPAQHPGAKRGKRGQR
jgi:ribosome maturation factor RimP